MCLVNGNYSINAGALSPSSSPQKAPSLGLPCPFPWCCVPTLPPAAPTPSFLLWREEKFERYSHRPTYSPDELENAKARTAASSQNSLASMVTGALWDPATQWICHLCQEASFICPCLHRYSGVCLGTAFVSGSSPACFSLDLMVKPQRLISVKGRG